MSVAAKVRPLGALATELAGLRARGTRMVLCHGVFDLLHIGHIRHLERARTMGDVLVVSVTADRYVNKGPDRPAFDEQMRAEAVAALNCVDYVAINQWPTAVETIRRLRPDVYVKGAEYRDPDRDVTGAIRLEREAVEAAGGRLAFTDEITFSSSSLLNRYVTVLPADVQAFMADFRQRHPADIVLEWLQRTRPLRVLVVGETIVDEYQYCHAIGKSSKAAAVVARIESGERFAGGIVAVANHIASLCDQVTVLSVLGTQNSHEVFIREQLHSAVRTVFVERRDAPTIVKRRFIEAYFFTPMFELYEINDESLRPEDNAEVCAALRREMAAHDLVVVVDYGHGMLSQDAVALLCADAKFLALNAQANAGNRGYHRLSKFHRADYICAAEDEMHLEARDWRGDLHPVVLDVSRRLSCASVVVTCGKRGALCYASGQGFLHVPALAGRVVDRVGAGDAFMAVTAPLVALGAPADLIGFLGNVAGAEAVATVGHRRYIERCAFAKHVQALLA
jgi:rfaE bifunctional protein nucleotidyltransferase chain/domain